jgi:CPA2 family monovalent cation:H+ antiporter-2
LFIAAVWLGERSGNLLSRAPRWTGGPKALVWLAAVLLALPLLVASFRKIRAAANVIAEMSVTRAAAREQTATVRAIIANTILIAASAALVLWILLLSSAILPPWPVMIALGAVAVLAAAAAWRSLVRVYARAQIALKETLTAEHAPLREAEPVIPLPPVLRNAILETIALAPNSTGAGKLIRELALRTRSGASIVGIERNGGSVVNPGPDEELLAGDRVLLIGTEPQLIAARELLATDQNAGTSNTPADR